MLSWTDFYMGLAFAVSAKSPDSETKHGCYITDRDNRPLGFGYNGHPRKADCNGLPVTRPEKYPWMFHSEANAVANCEHRPINGIAYVTGQCCNNCIYTLHQHGIKKVVMADSRGSKLIGEKELEWFKDFVKRTEIEVQIVKPKLYWLSDICDILDNLGYLDQPSILKFPVPV